MNLFCPPPYLENFSGGLPASTADFIFQETSAFAKGHGAKGEYHRVNCQPFRASFAQASFNVMVRLKTNFPFALSLSNAK